MVGQLPDDVLCHQTECPPPPVELMAYEDDGEWTGDTTSAEIPAGTYVLHLIADDSQTSVEVRLVGLSGQVDLVPDEPYPLTIQTLHPRVVTEPSQSVFWDGGFRSMQGPGMILQHMWLIEEPNWFAQWSGCKYSEEPTGPLAYAPPCHGADWRTTTGYAQVVIPPRLGRSVGWATATPAIGPWGLGQTIEVAGMVRAVGALNMWLEYA